MLDRVQDLLFRWHHDRDHRAAEQVFLLLKEEWGRIVARFLRRDLADPETGALLSTMLSRLLVAEDEGRPRALAPPDHPCPDRWRRAVLSNALRDSWRREQKRRSVVEAAFPQAASKEASLWGPAPAPSAEVRAVPSIEEVLALREMRERVAQLLPRLTVRRRVALALALGMDVTTWMVELADAQEEPLSGLYHRVDRVWDDPSDDLWKVRMLQPQDDPDKARDAYRKLVARAAADMKELLGGGQA